MKTWLRKHLALFLALCMCVSLCPISVAAGETDETQEVQAVTATAQPVAGSENEPVTVTTASVFPQNSNIYVKFDGLEFNGEYRILLETGSYSNDVYLYNYVLEPIVKSFYIGDTSLGEKEITLTICDSDKTPLYQPVTLKTQIVETTLPLTVEEVQAMTEATDVSVVETSFRVRTYLPAETLTGEESVRLEVVKDEECYAVSMDADRCWIDESYIWDKRYVGIFDENTYVPCKTQQVQGDVYCGKNMTAGSYDVMLYADDKLIAIDENAIVFQAVPMVSGQDFRGAAGAYNYEGSELAGCILQITNGDPADFQVSMLKDRLTEIGTSSGYRVLRKNSDSCTVVYYIPVEEPLENRTYYSFDVAYKGDGDFVLQSDEMSVYVRETVANEELSQFGSYYYANMVLPTAGYDAGVQYRFSLKRYGQELATAYAAPNNDGLFSVEFRDENGQLIELKQRWEYTVELYSDENKSYPEASWWLYNDAIWREQPVTLQSAEDTFQLELYDAGVNRTAGEQFYVYLGGEEETLSQLTMSESKFKLRLTSVTGDEQPVMNCVQCEFEGSECGLYFNIPETMAEVYFTPELLYDGKVVVNAENKNIFDQDDVVQNSREPNVHATYLTPFEVCIADSFYASNLYGQDLTVAFYSLDNMTAEPDKEITLKAKDYYEIRTGDLDGLNPAAKYQAVLSAGGDYVGTSAFAYWHSHDDIYGDEGRIGQCGTVTVAEGMEQYLEILPCYTNYVEEEGIPYFSEVYVNVTAPEGKALQYLTVNGEKICGNGFLFTEDCEVTAIFAEAETETYKVTIQMGWEEYVEGSTDGMTEEEMEELGGVEGWTPGSWVFKPVYTRELNLQPNRMHNLDLTIPAEYSQYKRGNIDARGVESGNRVSVSHDGTQTRWSLHMPEEDVLVKVYLQQKSSYRVTLYSDTELGTVNGLSEYAVEGSTVSFTATPNDGALLQSVYYQYYDYSNGGYQNITVTPDENGQYSFVMPSMSVQLYVNFVTSGPYAVNASAYGLGSVTVTPELAEGEEGYMAGQEITLTLAPQEGSRLVKKNGVSGVYFINGMSYDIAFTKVSETQYTFKMPHGDASIEVRYELTPGVAPGGKVVDSASLIEALGGEDNAVLNTETGAVELKQTLELFSPIVLDPDDVTEITLDLKGKRIYAVEDNDDEESGMLVLHENGLVRFTLTSSAYGGGLFTDGEVRNNFHNIWVRGGTLKIESRYDIAIQSAYAPEKLSCAGIRVVGGVAELVSGAYVEGQLAGDGVWATAGKVIIRGGSYHGGSDYDNRYANGLELMGGMEDYSWINSSTLGGSAIRASGLSKTEIFDCYAYGGANGAALHIDRNSDPETPCEVIFHNGYLVGEAGSALLIESVNAKLKVEEGTFSQSYADNGYSFKCPSSKCLKDYMADNRVATYLYRTDSNDKPVVVDDSSWYVYDYFKIALDEEITNINNALSDALEALPAEPAEQDIQNVQSTVSQIENLEEALAADTPDSNNGTLDVLKNLEEKLGTAEVEILSNSLPQAGASIVGAVVNAGGDAKLTVSEPEMQAEVPQEYQNALKFSMTLTNSAGEEVALTSPVKVTLMLPESINPALLVVLHYNEEAGEWEPILPYVYEEEGQLFATFVASSFSDFAFAHCVYGQVNGNRVDVAVDVQQMFAGSRQFLCAVYSEQGQMLGMTVLNAQVTENSIQLGDKIEDAYELRVFTMDTFGAYEPMFAMDTLKLVQE